MKSAELQTPARKQDKTAANHWLSRLARRLVLGKLAAIQKGNLLVEEAGAEPLSFGQPREDAEIAAHICVHHESTYVQILLNGTIGAGEAYMEGAWTSPDLVAVIRLMVSNMQLLENIDSRWSTANKFILRLLHGFNANTRKGARKNIAAHYDLGNDFFRLFLDETMMYSSAVFPRPDASLQEASQYKLDQICRKLQLKPGDHLLEIGTGWGGMALHAAKHYGCRVTTTTISRRQYEYVRARVAREGLADRINLLLQDYRELGGQYDKLVSIEMIEAVGHRFYHRFFRHCSHLLKSGGLMVKQAITIRDQRFDRYKDQVDFIQRYIFPGGCLPSNAIIAKHICEDTDMQMLGFEDITLHYAATLNAWRSAFLNKLDEVHRQGFDQQFVRMWEFYLCYCEGGFLERAIGSAQFVFAKPDYKTP
ncbi:class I SAM-dependent methyltransferase [Microbulbifer sp. TYP-18]|uniref:class I SAM-dependent methyltransferase n=1 Tax=Microbulbifer sp. TYP-18 TaxID=3230024 RepID=UPI0034C6A182